MRSPRGGLDHLSAARLHASATTMPRPTLAEIPSPSSRVSADAARLVVVGRRPHHDRDGRAPAARLAALTCCSTCRRSASASDAVEALVEAPGWAAIRRAPAPVGDVERLVARPQPESRRTARAGAPLRARSTPRRRSTTRCGRDASCAVSHASLRPQPLPGLAARITALLVESPPLTAGEAAIRAGIRGGSTACAALTRDAQELIAALEGARARGERHLVAEGPLPARVRLLLRGHRRTSTATCRRTSSAARRSPTASATPRRSCANSSSSSPPPTIAAGSARARCSPSCCSSGARARACAGTPSRASSRASTRWRDSPRPRTKAGLRAAEPAPRQRAVDPRRAAHLSSSGRRRRLLSPRTTPRSTRRPSRSSLTGPNMAGKSTHLRQVALITLMAHAGSFVSWRRRRQVPLTDRIWTRVGIAGRSRRRRPRRSWSR